MLPNLRRCLQLNISYEINNLVLWGDIFIDSYLPKTVLGTRERNDVNEPQLQRKERKIPICLKWEIQSQF